MPVLSAYETRGEYLAAVALYDELKEINELYKAEVALHTAYNAAVAAEMAADQTEFELALDETLVPSSTGRDNMLYPYVLTITPKYLNTNSMVVKVKVFEDFDKPISNKYKLPLTEALYIRGNSQTHYQGW